MKDKGQIKELFASISGSYDSLNQLFSLGMARFWRQMAAARMPAKGPYLDLCAGTLELSLTLLKQKKTEVGITAVDFCPAMLVRGRNKLIQGERGQSWVENIEILAGDGEHLPLRENIYQGVMIGFGLRNLINREAGLKEILRVLKPGGRLVVLEFSDPILPFFRHLYYLYFCHILPPLGNLLSKRDMAYNHLRDSVLAFPNRDELASMFLSTGFVRVRYQILTYGIAALHWGEKPE